eukprot:SAG22_NODE_13181_length_415_cov_1.401899_1_plen_62_part_10
MASRNGSGGGSGGEAPATTTAAATTTANLWVAGPGVTTAAHYDAFHNLLAQTAGTKQVLLLP